MSDEFNEYCEVEELLKTLSNRRNSGIKMYLTDEEVALLGEYFSKEEIDLIREYNGDR